MNFAEVGTDKEAWIDGGAIRDGLVVDRAVVIRPELFNWIK